jgi:cytoskeletal protein RodZ
VDFGTAADAPPGETRPLSNSVVVTCVVVPTGSNGAQVLAKADISIRWNPSDGLVCGLHGYPKSECAALVADPTPTPTRRPTPAKDTVGTAPTRVATPSHSAAPAGTTTASSTATPTAAPSTASPSATPAGVAVPEQTLPAAPVGALAATQQNNSGSPWPVALVVLILGALGGGTWWLRRRPT